MKLAIAALTIIALAGCGKPTLSKKEAALLEVPAASKPQPLTDEQKIALLTKEAKNRHLSWRVFCTKFYVDDPEGFQGTAWPKGTEDTDKVDRWMETGDTQADAAYALYISIQGDPTHPKAFICPLPTLSSTYEERKEKP